MNKKSATMKDALSREPATPVEKAFVADRAGDVLRWERQRLEVLFAPKSVAVIGATDKAGSVGRTIIYNLITNPFGGTVYPHERVRNAEPYIMHLAGKRAVLRLFEQRRDLHRTCIASGQ